MCNRCTFAIMIIHHVLMKFKSKSISITCLEWLFEDMHIEFHEWVRYKTRKTARYLFKSRIIRLWKSDDMRRLKDGREKSLSFGRSGWWFVGMCSCGFLSATLMSFSSRGRGPSLRIASCSRERCSWLFKMFPTFFFLFIFYQGLFNWQRCSGSVDSVEGKTEKIKGKTEGETDLLVYWRPTLVQSHYLVIVGLTGSLGKINHRQTVPSSR